MATKREVAADLPAPVGLTGDTPSHAGSEGPAGATAFTLWLTGLPGAGKSTLASLVQQALWAKGRRVEVLDGDEIRRRLSPDLGFSRAERDLNVHRIGYLASLLTRNGVVAVVAAVSPYDASRRAARAMHEVAFLEVFVDCDLVELRRRDPKGLYRQADAGLIRDFTGVSAPYERPSSPDLHVRTDRRTEVACVDEILRALCSRGLIG